MPSFLSEQKNRAVLNGRPRITTLPPPIGLFHPVFDSFQAEMKNHNPDPAIYQKVQDLIIASADIYLTENDRVQRIGPLLDEFLGQPFSNVQAPGVVCDGMIIWNSGSGNAYLLLREI